MDLHKFNKDAKKESTENRKFFEKLKRKKPSDLDNNVQNFHEEVFAHTDCLQCGNCCKTTSPIFYEKDIERASKSLGIKPGDFAHKYLHIDGDNDHVLNFAPCPFLSEDNSCGIYDDRPNACREYPHTNRKKFYQVLDLALSNTMVCPAVLEITKKLKRIYK